MPEITTARNEAALIEQTIRSVIAQTALPRKWIMSSDGSLTAQMRLSSVTRIGTIGTVAMPERHDRHFAGKAYAFNAGYAALTGGLLLGAPNLGE